MLIIPRQKLYSSNDKKDNKKEDKKTKRAGLVLTAGGGIINEANIRMGDKHSRDLENSPKFAEENKRIFKKLKDDAERRGVIINDVTKVDDSGPFYKNKGDIVYTNGYNDVSGISHELGHRHYYKEENTKKLGKLSHKGYKALGEGNSFSYSAGAGIAAGIGAGISKAKREEKEKKESKLGKISPVAAPVLIATPGLISEAAASKKGIEYLKKAGASKELIKKSKKSLGHAFGSYATYTAANAGLGLLSKEAAYKITKKRIKNKNKETDNNKK